MNKRMAYLLHFLSFVPALVMMYTIFGFSGDTGEESTSLSGRVTEQMIIILEQIAPDVVPDGQAKEEFAHTLQAVIRKMAHMAEYAILAITWIFALWVNGLKGKKLLYVTGIICFVYACTDEVHQLFVPGRSGKLLDVCVDMIGVGSALLIARLIKVMRKNKKYE